MGETGWTKLGMAQDANGQEVDVHHLLVACGVGYKMGKGEITLERFNSLAHYEEIVELLRSVGL